MQISKKCETCGRTWVADTKQIKSFECEYCDPPTSGKEPVVARAMPASSQQGVPAESGEPAIHLKTTPKLAGAGTNIARPAQATGQYYCNHCHNHTSEALKKGNGWIELVLYFFWVAPGVLYSIWRRSGTPSVCPLCKAVSLVPAAVAKPISATYGAQRDEIECPFCAETILAKATVCKHCGSRVRVSATDKAPAAFDTAAT